VSAVQEISSDSPVDRDLAGVRLLIDLTSAREQPLFVGIGRAGDVSQYLSDVNVARIDDLELSPFRYRTTELPGTKEPDRPDQQTFWVAKSVGTGEQSLSWRLRTDTYQVVVMNADASLGVDVNGSIGIKIPWIFWVALGLIIVGVLFLAGGVLLVVFGSKRRPVAGATGAGAVPVGYSPVPGQSFPPPGGPSAEQAWSAPPSAAPPPSATPPPSAPPPAPAPSPAPAPPEPGAGPESGPSLPPPQP